MKKIISQKLYNTETAKLLTEWENHYPCDDFNYCLEQLYQKKTGEFFLYGTGGALSKYAIPCGNIGWSGGSKITPLTLEQAQKWAEKVEIDADLYMEIFGEVEE